MLLRPIAWVGDPNHRGLGEAEGNDERYAYPCHDDFISGQGLGTDDAGQDRGCDEQPGFEKREPGDRGAEC
jgi:hypothetical protein